MFFTWHRDRQKSWTKIYHTACSKQEFSISGESIYLCGTMLVLLDFAAHVTTDFCKSKQNDSSDNWYKSLRHHTGNCVITIRESHDLRTKSSLCKAHDHGRGLYLWKHDHGQYQIDFCWNHPDWQFYCEHPVKQNLFTCFISCAFCVKR